jgi:epoxyqueuosine reductase
MTPLANELFDMIEERGWKAQIVPIDHFVDLREAIQGRYNSGLLDEELYQEQLSSFSFDPPADLPDARSIIIVAVPTPQMRVFFHWQGNRVPVVIPPTYVSYTPRTESVQAVLATWLEQLGYRMAKPQLPLKTLAARSGLAEYGRNNITYVPGIGSFLQLVGAFTDLPSDGDPWREPKPVDTCDSCIACLRHCPTGAIADDRFLLYAERCLTYHNEAAGEFPDWINPSWHHCLFGCMRCQTICPENEDVLDWFDDRVEFSEQKTNLLIQRTPFDHLPTKTAAKLKSLEINEDYLLLCRNLSMIIGREAAQP